ncbi:lanC-like protein GCR2, partial [Magnolia sinica]|uniref:lanC-like protein GCR2 n=1 Tax=Magnolia sinica TaxID=86752 RepID=UPI002659FCC1
LLPLHHSHYLFIFQIVKETWVRAGRCVRDFTLYTGSLGTAFLLFKAYEVTKNKNDLNLCIEIVRACDTASRESRHVTFICGQAGVCALSAVAAKNAGDHALLNHYLSQFKAGMVVKEIIKDGIRLANKGSCPLMYVAFISVQ